MENNGSHLHQKRYGFINYATSPLSFKFQLVELRMKWTVRTNHSWHFRFFCKFRLLDSVHPTPGCFPKIAYEASSDEPSSTWSRFPCWLCYRIQSTRLWRWHRDKFFIHASILSALCRRKESCNNIEIGLFSFRRSTSAIHRRSHAAARDELTNLSDYFCFPIIDRHKGTCWFSFHQCVWLNLRAELPCSSFE